MKVFFSSLCIVSFFLFFSCQQPERLLDVDLSEVDYEFVHVKRYEQTLFSINTDSIRLGLENVRGHFEFFLPEDLDTFDIIKMKNYLSDPTLKQTYIDVEEIFPSLDKLEEDLNLALKYLRFHLPDILISHIYTYISGFDFEYPVKYVDSVLIIALDMYLGANYYFYPMIGMPLYLAYSMRQEYIVRDCVELIARSKINENIATQTFLDKMVYEGKVLYLVDAALPSVHDSLKIIFTNNQLEWCKRNEDNIWSFFIDQKFLYNNDRKIITRFMDKGPFTPSFAKESPARTGVWIGWQIVRAFMRNNPDVSVEELFLLDDAQYVLNKSKYKPRKK